MTLARRRWLVWPLATLLVLALVAVFVQPVRVRLVAAASMAEALDLPVVRAFAPDVEQRRVTLGGVEADLYDPGPSAPAVVAIPGATPAGRTDPRAVALAESLARAGRAVVVPELEVYGEDLVLEDVDRIGRVVRATAEERGPVVLLGFSFGGSLGLVAAADPQVAQDLELVATFGAYFDLVGVLQAATTGVALVDGQRLPWEPDPRAHGIVEEELLGLLPAEVREQVRAVLAGDADPGRLPGEVRAAYEVLVNDDPARTAGLVAELPDPVRERVAAVSPSTVADRLDVPVVAMHALDDPAVPYAELVRLGAAIPDARLITVESFRHVDFDLGSPGDWPQVVGDLWRVWSFATAILDAHDGWWPGSWR